MIKFNVVEESNLAALNLPDGIWQHAIVHTLAGDYVLAEVSNSGEYGYGWCYASDDIFDPAEFDEVLGADPDYYPAKDFVRYQQEALRGVIIFEKEKECEE